jgi:hypothetical protein
MHIERQRFMQSWTLLLALLLQIASPATVAQSFFGSLPIDGIKCDREEGSAYHVHTQLQLYDRGRAVPVPAQIGMPQTGGCLYWLHTHSTDGFIHIESPVKRPFTLGEFFDIWGGDLSSTRAGELSAAKGRRLSIWIDGVPWHGHDPRAIVLRDHETVVIQNGPPFAKPVRADWSKL